MDGIHGVDDARHERVGVAAQIVAVDRRAECLGGLGTLACSQVVAERGRQVVAAGERPVARRTARNPGR